MMDEIISLSINELGERIRSGVISPVEILGEYMKRILCYDHKLNAFSEIYEADARAAAKHAEQEIRSGNWRGPLHGIPFAVKDFFDLKGKVTGGGTNCFSQKAYVTAPVVATLLKQGMILTGKHRAVELGMGAAGIMENSPTPLNPWGQSQRVAPGGSSNGSAVAVAAGLTPIALVTDTGGSARIPAAWCGVSGFRPSMGNLSSSGMLPLSQTMDTVGIIAKHASDIFIVYNQLNPNLAYHSCINNLNIGILPSEEEYILDKETGLHYASLLEVFSQMGMVTQKKPFPYPLSQCMKANSIITAFEAWQNYGYLCNSQNSLSDTIKVRLERGKEIKEKEYSEALIFCRHVRKIFSNWFQNVDALVIPTTPEPSWPIAEKDEHQPPNDFTRFVNFADLCAVSIPTGLNSQGLPFSLQIVCNRKKEKNALALAELIECRIGFSDTALKILLKT
ncbi:amidase [Photorhabdus laumondii]|uniref:Amidase domain-containing protein n=1 Tax=Photorhabdus laumondii subsp. clarkei TaxID=2029685 RepID=A0A329VPQ8_9GAMM|nr:amidase [Photorhabdus laumondii]RAW93692.1 hypothetical protein CKY01_01880 [Photorhabdus laumondii subsp. clarkei]